MLFFHYAKNWIQKKADILCGCQPCKLVYKFRMFGELDVVAPSAEDLMQLRTSNCTEVCQHHVA